MGNNKELLEIQCDYRSSNFNRNIVHRKQNNMRENIRTLKRDLGSRGSK